ncbi:MAG: threonine--tRNA ligase [bacterium]
MAIKISEFGPLETMRHSAAHVLAAAIVKLFPEAKLGVGPVIENGFYYDVKIDRAITPEDFKNIEHEMHRIINAKLPMKREEMKIDEAIKFFADRGQDFKVDLLKDLKTRGTTAVSEDEAADIDSAKLDTASVYYTGDFVDLCRGPHVENTGKIGVVKIDKIAAAYWRGKETNPQLQRIYGLCFENKEALNKYEQLLEEAKKRDHRKLGVELDLFAFSPLVGPGLPLFTPKGAMMRRLLEEFVWSLMKPYGYQRVWIPHMAKTDLYKTSGHWDKFADDIFHITSKKSEDAFVMKPMNCPHHTQIFASSPRSYRDLPIRYSEVTTCYRDENTGQLAGLTRVRSLTQDDAHIFCTMDQVKQEVLNIYDIITKFYATFGMSLRIRLSTNDPEHPEKTLGGPEIWEKAIGELRGLLVEMGKEFEVGVGEAAFYGPKIDFMAKDAIGREWQLATVQLDFNLPERFQLEYNDSDGTKKRPVMIHRAISGSIERFLGVIIEHYAGVFPTWLSPVQVKVLAVGESHREFAKKLVMEFGGVDIRAEVDVTDDTVGKKIRRAEAEKVPFMLVVGDKEAGGGTLAVRRRGERETVEMEKSAFIELIGKENTERK